MGFDPYQFLRQVGVRVEHGHLSPTTFGEWWPEQQLIVMDSRLSRRQEYSTLAHECGHVALGHTECTDATQEAADRWAAQQLIDPHAYRRAERLYPQNWAMIAEELDVMEWVVRCWRRDETNRQWAAYFQGEDQIA